MSFWISDCFCPFKYAERSFLPRLPPKTAPLTVPYSASTPRPKSCLSSSFRSPPDPHWLCFQKRSSIWPLPPDAAPTHALVTAPPEYSHSFPCFHPCSLFVSSQKSSQRNSLKRPLLSLKLPDISPSSLVKSKVFSRPVVGLAPFPLGPHHPLFSVCTGSHAVSQTHQVYPRDFALTASCLTPSPSDSCRPYSLIFFKSFPKYPSSLWPSRVPLSERHLPMLNFFLPRSYSHLTCPVLIYVTYFCLLHYNAHSMGLLFVSWGIYSAYNSVWYPASTKYLLNRWINEQTTMSHAHTSFPSSFEWYGVCGWLGPRWSIITVYLIPPHSCSSFNSPITMTAWKAGQGPAIIQGIIYK